MDPNQKSITENDVVKVKKVNKVFRVLGPILLLLGVGSMIFGIISMSSDTMQDYFYFMPIGIPVLFVGILLTAFGYMGSVQKYMAVNVAPVAKDTASYMVEGTSDAVSDLAGKVSDKMAINNKPKKRKVCPNCKAINDFDMKFCGECGESLAPKRESNKD